MAIMTRADARAADAGAVARQARNMSERLNALSDTMLAALLAELKTLAGQTHIGAVIIACAGKEFRAGHDKEMTAGCAAGKSMVVVIGPVRNYSRALWLTSLRGAAAAQGIIE